MNNDDSIFEVGINFLYSFKCDLVLALIWIFFFIEAIQSGKIQNNTYILNIPALFSQDEREGIYFFSCRCSLPYFGTIFQNFGTNIYICRNFSCLNF